MRINTPQNRINNYRYSAAKITFRGPVENFGKQIGDVFYKTSISPAEKQTFLEKLKNLWTEIINPERILGMGFQGTVYKIDDNFAMKIRNTEKYFRDTQIVESGVKKFDSLETYFGEPIGIVGKSGSVKILKNLGEHIPAGIPETIIKKAASEESLDKYYETKYLPSFAKIPQESYDAIARDFAKLNKMPAEDGEYFSFDGVNPNNIVLANGKLMLTDDIDNVISPDTNSSGKLLDILLYRMTRLKRTAGYGENNKDAKEIFKKIIIASEKVNLPYKTLPKDTAAWEKVSQNLGITEDIVPELETLRYKYPDINERIPEVEKYINQF